jgi:hypothetical protein
MTQYFSDTCNLLTNISKVKEFPFPYAGIFNCLPEDVYAELVAKRPPWQAIAQEHAEANNKRVDLTAFAALQSKTLAPIWLDFIRYHTSHAFYLQILDNFDFYFKQYYPHLGDMWKYKTAVRYSLEKADIYMDCQLSINTPVKEKSTVNHPHVDNPLELWASLLYMKEPDDNAGGNLVLHKCIKPPTFHGKREADLDCTKPVLQIPYTPNTYVCFVNSPMSIHSVTEREVTDKPRLMINLSLEFMKEPLFNVQ